MHQLPKVAIYLRVSSDEQASKGHSPDMQLQACLAKLNERFGENLYLYEVFQDLGYSGRLGLYDPQRPKKPHRPELTRLKNCLDQGEFDAVCVYGLDRLSRNYSLLPRLIEEVFGQGDVELISVRELGIDLATPTGRAIAQILNASNALICDISSQIQRDTSRRRRELGYPVKPAFGWRWKATKDPNGRRGIEPNPEQAEVVKYIINQFLEGASLRGIAKELVRRGIKTARGTNRWCKHIVAKIILQPLHYGLVRVTEGEYVRGAHFEDRFFDPEVFDHVTELMQQRSFTPPSYDTRPEYLLGGLIYCGHCGAKMRGRKGRGRFRVYCCNAAEYEQKPLCSRNSCRADWVEGEVLEEIGQLLMSPKVAEQARKEALAVLHNDNKQLRRKVQQLEASIQRLERRLKRWRDLLADAVISPQEYTDYRDQLLTERAALDNELQETKKLIGAGEDFERQWQTVQQALSDIAGLWERMTSEERKAVIREVVERVDMTQTSEGDFKLRIKLRFQEPVSKIISPPRGMRSKGQVTLTKRQMEALWLRIQGLSHREAAKKLGITVQALNTLLCRASRRLGAKNTREAFNLARDIIPRYLKWLDLEGREQRVSREPSPWSLGPEQERVLEALARGLKGPQIARQLEISVNTVYVHLH
ncbi:MAG: recombinase family protein, partial [Armatimonadetes bacterium]|nr:recombinase family protein [Armatimonadota bacterium]